MKRMSTTLLIIGSVVLTVVLVWQLTDINREDKTISPDVKENPRVTVTSSNSNRPSVALPIKVIWSTVSADEYADIPGYPLEVDDAVKIRFDPTGLRSLVVGDVIAVHIPQNGTEYRVEVNRTKLHPGGIKIISARNQDNDPALELLLTLGLSNTFAHLDTEEGSFELVGNLELGWLMNSANMDQHVDYSKPDYVVPERINPPDQGGI